MLSNMLTAGLVALGCVGVLAAIAHALPSETRTAQTLTWLVPVAVLWFTAIAWGQFPVDLALALVAFSAYTTMMVSRSALRWWWRNVLRSRDPWVVRDVSPEEESTITDLVAQLRQVADQQARVVKSWSSKGTADLNPIVGARARVAQLSPPSDDWAQVIREATSQIDLILDVLARPPNSWSESDIAAVKDGWHELYGHVHALRNDQALPHASGATRLDS
jgi:hypothetical protein